MTNFIHLTRRQLLQASLGSAGLLLTSAPRLFAQEEKIDWYNVEGWGVEGKGFTECERYYDRLPATAKTEVRDAVWNLSRHSAGMLTRFETDAREIHVRYDLFSSRLAMAHMPATGVSGIDLYGRNDAGEDRWVTVTRPASQHVEVKMFSGIDPRPSGQPRLYTAYLPLYNGINKLEFGVPKGAVFKPIAPRKVKPIVFYGTSIMHGACASRPGMSISALLGRRYDIPTINLGFSGNGRLELEVGQYLAQLDPAVYCIDCLPNLTSPQVGERAEPLVNQLREAHPETPIVLVEDRTYTNAPFFESSRKRHAASRKELREAFEKLKAAGDQNLYYLEGDIQLGDDGEAATDGSHPNDLGFMRYADAYATVLDPLLEPTP